MRVVVAYDISDDVKRLKLANHLKALGLSRIQRSAFAGMLDSSRLRDLYRLCERFASEEGDVIHVFTLCGYDWSRRMVFGFFTEVSEGVVVV
ncbi:MAG: CRISPR-associated endonuclease Cas2 [Thermofilaceae archaeon]